MGLVQRIYVERKPGFALEAESLAKELSGTFLPANLRILNRYDVEGLTGAELERCVPFVFADPFTDEVLEELENLPGLRVLAVEYLPGQYDQRADAAEKCLELLTGKRPVVRTARVYLFHGDVSDADFDAVKKRLINPVDSREAVDDVTSSVRSASQTCHLPPSGGRPTPHFEAPDVPVIEGFRSMTGAAAKAFLSEHGLAMSEADLLLCVEHFRAEGRDPTVTELRVLDTYWSDHCRHSTFLTRLGFTGNVTIEDQGIQSSWDRYLRLRQLTDRADKPITLMDIGTIGARALKMLGKLNDLVESEEVNACTVRVPVTSGGRVENWLVLFKNETHNHPTEIEPFGGAATCIGGAIRDPLSGRGYVYQAMRLTGAADPRSPLSETLRGRLPQREITTRAADGYSSYGNQIGVPSGIVDEVYHEGYRAKRMEIGAVIAAVPDALVRRERPEAGDVVFLLGGRTGRDGIGGATGSSRGHTAHSIEFCGAEVQKGNAPEERKLQRLFRNPEFVKLVKCCNDFGAGGVSVAVGELADGLDIDLDAVPLKYAGLDGTETAISESQERMAVVVSSADAERVKALADSEDVEATVIARVTDTKRVVMRWRGKTILDLPRSFIESNGAPRHADVIIPKREEPGKNYPRTPFGAHGIPESFLQGMRDVASDLNVCSKRGLAERFDSTIGAGAVLMPFGGRRQRTPVQAMVSKIPGAFSDDCTCMAWGFDPFISSASPYDGAYLAVVEALCRLACVGAPLESCHLSFQEYFGSPGDDPRRWGLPAAALLGALDAQMDLGVAAIGGKDSMSGTYIGEDGERLDVPPTLVAFAQGMTNAFHVVSPEFKRTGSRVVLLRPKYEGLLPEPGSMLSLIERVHDLLLLESAHAVATPGFGGAAALVLKMTMGNGLGFNFDEAVTLEDIFGHSRGSFIVELADGVNIEGNDFECLELGHVTGERKLRFHGVEADLNELEDIYENVLEDVFPMKCEEGPGESLSLKANSTLHTLMGGGPTPPRGARGFNSTLHTPHSTLAAAKPRFIIPVFPGTNCEYESARAIEHAGGTAEVLVVRTRTHEAMTESLERFAERLNDSQGLFLPGGFSNGDEPDGSGKFIAIFLRSPVARDAVTRLLDERGGLICGVCNGFQALVRTGLIPFGRISDRPAEMALTFNAIGRHQSKLIRARVVTNRSPWLSDTRVGDVHTMPISHGEGRFVCTPELLSELAEGDQIATQYVDEDGGPTMDVQYNPNGSLAAIEGLISPDGRVFGRMGHAERVGMGLYRNAWPVEYTKMFDSAVEFLKRGA